YYGPFSVLSEYVLSSQQISFVDAAEKPKFRNTAWHVTLGWILTGEKASYRGVTPSQPFNPRLGHWGAWQLVARYEQLDVDRGIFSSVPLLSYADPDASARSAYAWSVGLNWWLNRNVRVNASFSHTWFQGGGYLNPLDPATP